MGKKVEIFDTMATEAFLRSCNLNKDPKEMREGAIEKSEGSSSNHKNNHGKIWGESARKEANVTAGEEAERGGQRGIVDDRDLLYRSL